MQLSQDRAHGAAAIPPAAKLRWGRTVSLWILAAIALLAALAAIARYYPLAAFNLLVPKDSGARVMATGQPYGAHPRQKLDVYAPAKPGAGAPVVVFFYGGAWKEGRRQDYGFLGRALAARGFVTIVPDYRLLPETRFPGFVEDCAAAVRWARANARRFGGDGERIVLAGHSAGAYNAAMLALDPQWLGADRAAVRGFAALAGPMDFLPLDDSATIAAFGGWPRLEETQPVHFASRDDPPALLLHGADDGRVRLRNSQRLTQALRGAGAHATLVTYAGTGHAGILTAIARPFRGRAAVLDDLARFVERVSPPSPDRR
jgi:acetyl esterase/lipase